MMHGQCYIDYTRCLEEQSQDVDKDDNNDGQRKMKGDFDQVKDFIQDAIIESEKAVSITVVHRIYGTGYGHEHEKVYRNRLKSTIVDEFGDESLFLNVDGQTPDVIVSRAALDSTTVVTTDVRQPWKNPQDCYFEYLIIRFDYLIIRFDYLIIG